MENDTPGIADNARRATLRSLIRIMGVHNGRRTAGRGLWRLIDVRRVLWPVLVGVLVASLVGCSRPIAVHGLRPIYPETQRNSFNKVDSFQPTLRWESFPRPQDREGDTEGLLSRIRNVIYDLRVWRVAEENMKYPGELIYSRRGLLEPLHTLEEPLLPSTKYFWSVRARFELDDQPRVTQWGVTEHPQYSQLGRLPIVPNPLHYRFKTPSR